MEKIVTALVVFVGVLALVVLFSFINAIFISLLWNWLVPTLLPQGPLIATITYWQAWGISLFCGTLFKGSCMTNSCKKD